MCRAPLVERLCVRGSALAPLARLCVWQRIGHQLKLAKSKTLNDWWSRVLGATHGLESLFEGIKVFPSTLHGDLWSGNIGSVEGEPVIFDPATYYGHHEAEWGMGWCAGHGPAFWSGYRTLIPKDPGFEERNLLYTLYHIINHYNLFGSGYESQAPTREGRRKGGSEGMGNENGV